MKKIYSLIVALACFANLNAQVSTYTFAQYGGTFNSISSTGTKIVGVPGIPDSEVRSNMPIGFTFTYNSTAYTSFGFNVNGWINMGSTTPVSTSFPLSSGSTNNVISGFGRDLHAMNGSASTTLTTGSNTVVVSTPSVFAVGDSVYASASYPTTGGVITSITGNTIVTSANATANSTTASFRRKGYMYYQTIGSAPNRTLVVEWNRVAKFGANGDNFSFQIRLLETTNEIEVVYGTYQTTVTASNTSQVGLRGNTNTDFNNRIVTVAQPWSNSIAGTANSSTAAFSSTLLPALGQVYKWGPQNITLDMASNGWASPAALGCYGLNQTVSAIVKNNATSMPIDFAVDNTTVSVSVTGPNPATFTTVLTTGTLAAGASQTVVLSTTYNMSAAGSYVFNGSVTTTGDMVAVNNAQSPVTRIVTTAMTAPYSQDFNASTALPTGWTTTGFSVLTNHGGNTWNNNALSRNIYGTGSTTIGIANLPKMGGLNANSMLTYEYRIQDWSGYPASGATSTLNYGNDSLNVFISTDCGATYSLVQSLNASNYTPTLSMTTRTVSLGAYAGMDIMIRFVAKKVPAGTGDYYVDLDNINITAPIAIDAGVSALVSPASAGCYGSSENVAVTITNYGINSLTNIPVTVTVSGAVSQTLTGTYTGTITAGATANFTVGVLNMSTAGTYSFDANTSMPGDGFSGNDAMATATRTTIVSLPLPYSENFNSVVGNVVPTGWSADNNSTYDFLVTNNIAEHGVATASVATRGLAGNLYSGNATSWANMPKVGPLTSTSYLTFQYRVVDYSGYANPGGPATALTNNDSLKVRISTDCGATFTTIDLTNGANHVDTNAFAPKMICLGAYAGSNAIIRFEGVWSTGDYYWDIDDITIMNMAAPIVSASNATMCAGNTNTLSSNSMFNAGWYTNPTGGTAVATGTMFTTPVLSVTTTYYAQDSLSGSCFVRTPYSVSVTPNPTVIPSSSSSSICAGSSATLSAVGATSYTWSSGAMTASTVESPTVTTTYTVMGEAAGCSGMDVITLSVTPIPVVSASASSSTLCSGNSATLTAMGATTYSWSSGAMTAMTVESPITTTTYTVWGDSAGCAGMDMVTLNVTTTPTLAVSASPVSICSGASSTLTANGATSYTWSTGTMASGIVESPTVTTTYTVNGENSGCFGMDVITLSVTTTPTVNASASSMTICSGVTTTLTANGASTYSWSSGAMTASTVESPTSNTTYTVTGDNGGCIDTDVISIAVNASPTVAAATSNSIICTGSTVTLTASGATTYTWSSGTMAATSVESPTSTVSYTVTGTDANGCEDTDTLTQFVSACTGIDVKLANAEILLYPNPNQGTLNIYVSDVTGKVSFELYDALGRVVMNMQLTDNLTSLNTAELPGGVYTYKISSSGVLYQQGKLIRD
jgi:hypothetical protein